MLEETIRKEEEVRNRVLQFGVEYHEQAKTDLLKATKITGWAQYYISRCNCSNDFKIEMSRLYFDLRDKKEVK